MLFVKRSFLWILKSSLLLFIALPALSGGFSAKSSREVLASLEKDTLRLAIDIDMPGYFTLSGERFGFQYETAKAFAESSGTGFSVVADRSIGSIREMLESGEVDFAATLTSKADELNDELSLELYRTTYVVMRRVTSSRDARTLDKDNLLTQMAADGGRILVSEGFTGTKSYDRLLDSLTSAHIYITTQSGYLSAEQLSAGDFGWLVCEKSEAQLATELVRNVAYVYEFDEPVSMCLLFGNRTMRSMFEKWYDRFRCGEDYAMLNYLYFNEGIVGQLTALSCKQPATRRSISVWDALIRKVAEREGVDWRLLSAIAYHESRFSSDAVSHRGAQGLMQLMPVVAREFDMEGEDISDPEINIVLASKLLKRTDRALRFDPQTPVEDRTSIVLAAYNCGMGRVIQARRIIANGGGDPDSWYEVSETLSLMHDPDYVTRNKVATGIFRESSTTLAYVDQVMSKYDSYCRTIN